MIGTRIVKEPEVRRNEILDAAERLFAAKGFDQTSISDILDAVGIARGTLYYHFRSKEEILDAMIGRSTQQLMAKARSIANDRSLPALQRITLALMALNMENDLGHVVMEQVHKPQNALMHQKLQQELLAGVDPIITGLVEECMAQGICHTDYPAETVEMIMLYSNTAFDAMADADAQSRQRRIEAFIYNLERLFGMERGSMHSVVAPIFAGQPSTAHQTMEERGQQ